MTNDGITISVEETFSKSIEEVWKAITELTLMKQWFFENIPAFEPIVGFSTKFNVQAETQSFMHLWKIIEVIPNQKIVYNWKYEEYEGDGNVIFELSKTINGTKLKITSIVLKSYPKDIPEFTSESCLAGWIYFIKLRLKQFLDNQ